MFDNIDFDFNLNRITYRYIGNVEKNIRVEINDIDNNLRLHITDTLVTPYISYWMISNYSFSNTNGVSVSFTDESNRFCYTSKKTGLNKNLYINGNKTIFENLDWCEYGMYDEVIQSNTYNKIEINKDDTIIDIGANIGVFTLLCLSKGAKKIYSVEPVEKTFEVLNKNTINYNNVKIFNFGLSNFNKNAIFSSNGWSSINSLYSNNDQKIPVTLISAESFFNYIEEENIDIMKIDVEGSEYDIFESISDKNILRVNKFIMEFHKVDGRNLKDIHNIINRLINLGYFYNGSLWTQDDFDSPDWRSFNNLYFKK